MNEMKIFLIGLPGAGKTTIGKQLAQSLHLPFLDLDAEIEKEERLSINQIFEKKKEDYFRVKESAQLKKWCYLKTDFVMATGGGAPCFFDNMEMINRAGKSIFLDVSAREIATRMMKSEIATRPLLAKKSEDEVKDRIEFLRSHRLQYYQQAKIVINKDQISLEEILLRLKS
jgi:shikimate kinase